MLMTGFMAADLKILVLLPPLFFLLISSSAAAQSSPRLSSQTEWQALLDLRSSLGISAKYWHKKANPCSNWTGIECKTGHVSVITLSSLRRSVYGRRNPRFAVDSLPSFRFLSGFISSGFLLPGHIPDWLGQKMNNLEVLDLSSSSISGSIPSSLGSLSKLRLLNLSRNLVTGNLPTVLQNLLALSVLDLSQNSLTGQIPTEVSSLRNLTTLDLSSNYLSGEIPHDLGQLSFLELLNLSRNSLSSSIPPQIGNLSLMQKLDLGSNSLSGELPNELGGLTGLKFLDVSGNNLTGIITNRTLSSTVAAAFFNFSYNQFYGNLTFASGDASEVDLSNNYFQGEAPAGGRFHLSNNCFFNISSQRDDEECFDFYTTIGIPYGNESSSREHVPPPLMAPTRKKTRPPYLMIGLLGGPGLILIALTLLFLLLRLRKIPSRNQQERRSNDRSFSTKDLEQPPKFLPDLSKLGDPFTFEQLLVATSNFSSENLIKQGHSGSLFQAILGREEIVVVKKVELYLHPNGKESFMSELEFFSKAAHQRLVPLIGHCLDDEDTKFLVYKYMPNGDLSNALYRMRNSEEGVQSLDWITRLKIAMGAAEALSYLHSECNPPFVHRDVQASSILLDDEYEVRLGSFSQVCESGSNNNQNVVAKLIRAPQTSGRRPSGSRSVTCAYDVYCFGKVLLELVTGKLGIGTMNEDEAKQWLDSNLPFISIYEKELVHKIVDQSLIIDEDLLEEVWAVAVVAKSCLNPRASRRPSMRHVVKALENPFKVVRDENFSSGSTSRQSWTAAWFGSWHRSSSESSNRSSQTSREIIGGLRQGERVGSRGSGTNDHSSSHKRSSSDVFPEPVEMHDVENGS